jgi:hypothetical protein
LLEIGAIQPWTVWLDGRRRNERTGAESAG